MIYQDVNTACNVGDQTHNAASSHYPCSFSDTPTDTYSNEHQCPSVIPCEQPRSFFALIDLGQQDSKYHSRYQVTQGQHGDEKEALLCYKTDTGELASEIYLWARKCQVIGFCCFLRCDQQVGRRRAMQAWMCGRIILCWRFVHDMAVRARPGREEVIQSIVRTDFIYFCIAQYGQYDSSYLSRFVSSADKALFVDVLTWTLNGTCA